MKCISPLSFLEDEMAKSTQNIMALRPHRRHPRQQPNPFDLAIDLKPEIEHMPHRTADKGRSFELLLAPRSLRQTAARPELKAA